jgi:hypothetical protein
MTATNKPQTDDCQKWSPGALQLLDLAFAIRLSFGLGNFQDQWAGLSLVGRFALYYQKLYHSLAADLASKTWYWKIAGHM